jgi:hypothetical protein
MRDVDEKLQRYRMLHNTVTDNLAVQMIREMIDTLAAEKNMLHRPMAGLRSRSFRANELDELGRAFTK